MSKEGILPISEFQIKSDGIAESGSICIKGKIQDHHSISLSVEAFGQTIDIPDAILSQLPLKQKNGIQLSYEYGYKELAGKTIYIKFIKGFTSGSAIDHVLAISEDRNIEIIPNRQ